MNNTFDKITLDTFKILIEEKIPEDNSIEYKSFKFINGKIDEEQKKKIEKEIVALANADGGAIFIGIKEDDNKVACALEGIGCGREKFDEIQLTIQNRLLAKVRPRIYGIRMQYFELDDNEIVISIRIPKSISRPHAVNDGNKDIFYKRNANTVTYMSIDDLRRDILSGAYYQEEIKIFRNKRIGLILDNDYIRKLDIGAKLLLHVVPLWSMEYGNIIELNKFSKHKQFIPMGSSSYETIYCSDGIFAFHVDYNDKLINSSLLILRNGAIEGLNSRFMNKDRENKLCFTWTEVEKLVYNYISDCSVLLNDINIPKPWYIFISIINGKGYRTTNAWGEFSHELTDNFINGVECVWNEGQEIIDVVKPIFDSLSNAFGYAESIIN